MKRISKMTMAAVLGIAILAAAGCSTGSGTQSASKFPEKPIEFIAPSGAGGGWDTTARTAAKILVDEKISSQPITVQNKAGGGGAVGLVYLKSKKGDGYTVNVYSPPLLLNYLNGSTPDSYKDTTPLAQVMTDYEVFVVSANSKYQDIKSLFAAAKADPKSIKLGGGSAPGSMDHIAFVMAAKKAGVNVKDLPYVSFQGGGEAMTALLGGHIDVISTGIGEAAEQERAGKVKIIAVTAPSRVEIIKHVPTLKESGIDSQFFVWRGFFGPPNMPEDAKKFFEGAFKKMLETEAWKTAAKNNGWITEYKNSADFTKFLEGQSKDMDAVLKEIGLKK